MTRDKTIQRMEANATLEVTIRLMAKQDPGYEQGQGRARVRVIIGIIVMFIIHAPYRVALGSGLECQFAYVLSPNTQY